MNMCTIVVHNAAAQNSQEIIFLLILQIIITAQMFSTGDKGEGSTQEETV